MVVFIEREGKWKECGVQWKSCSRCGHIFHKKDVLFFNYCPFCGSLNKKKEKIK